ncbi:MAG: glycerate kinase [Candidatus Homeothermus sp.]|nr:glycerate kinase [Candidatus Homeothermus sp.]
MRIVIAPDKYKGTLTSAEAGEALREGVLKACPDAKIHLVTMADGGEGTAAILAKEMGFTRHTALVHPPLPGLPMTKAAYYYSEAERAMLFDSATAIGLTLIPTEKRDVMHSSSAPVGELLHIVMQRHEFLNSAFIGLGGTATCDGGMGMVFYLAHNKVPVPSVVGLYDAGVPLLAADGSPSALTFAPQKGATPDDMELLEKRLRKAASMMPGGNPDTPGAGAAGGLGFAILSIGGKLCPGVDVVAGSRISRLNPDIIITGEGRIDCQSAMGKVLSYFIGYRRKHGTPVIAVGGCVEPGCLLTPYFTEIISADRYEPRDVNPITPEVAAWRLKEAIADRLPDILRTLHTS